MKSARPVIVACLMTLPMTLLTTLATAPPSSAQEAPALASGICELAGGWAVAVDGRRSSADLRHLAGYAEVIVREHPGRAEPQAWRAVILATLARHESDARAAAWRTSARTAAAMAAASHPGLARAAIAEARDGGGWRGAPLRAWRRFGLKRAARRACADFEWS